MADEADDQNDSYDYEEKVSQHLRTASFGGKDYDVTTSRNSGTLNGSDILSADIIRLIHTPNA